MSSSLEPFRAKITKAVGYTDGAYTFEDIQQGVDEGWLHALFLPESVLIYTIEERPQYRVCNVFLVAGRMADMGVLESAILEVAKIYQCKRMSLTGRRGWARSFLTNGEWKESRLVTLEREV